MKILTVITVIVDKEMLTGIITGIIPIIISVISLIIALITLYYNFIRPAKIKLIMGNTCQLYYLDYSTNNNYGLGVYLPIDFVNISNKTGIVSKTAILLYNKKQDKEHFLMQQRNFSTVDTSQKKMVNNEFAHSIVIPPKTSVNKIVWYNWENLSLPHIKLAKGEYVIKLYYWIPQYKKPKIEVCDLYIDDKIEASLNKCFNEKSVKTVEVALNKEFDYNKCITKKEESLIIKGII